MEKDLEKFLNKARQVKLSNNERDDLRGKLEEFIWQNPIKIREQKGRAFSFSFISWRVGVALALFLMLATSAGASVLAQKALPGDKLYAVKTGLNEEVKTFFAFTDEAKAKVNADLAEVRLLEVEKLAEKGKLDREKREKLEREFKARADKFEAKVKKIEEDFEPTQSVPEEIDSNKAEISPEVQKENKKDERKIKAKEKSEKLKKKFEERLEERERALESVRLKKNEEKQKALEQKDFETKKDNAPDEAGWKGVKDSDDNEDEDDEDEVEPILKEVRGRIKKDRD